MTTFRSFRTIVFLLTPVSMFGAAPFIVPSTSVCFSIHCNQHEDDANYYSAPSAGTFMFPDMSMASGGNDVGCVSNGAYSACKSQAGVGVFTTSSPGGLASVSLVSLDPAGAVCTPVIADLRRTAGIPASLPPIHSICIATNPPEF
jgi:hypothetical protein